MCLLTNVFATITFGFLRVILSETCHVMQICRSKFPTDSSSESSSFRQQLLEVASPQFPASEPFQRTVIETRRVLISDEDIKHHWTPLSPPSFSPPRRHPTSFCCASCLSRISSWLLLRLALSGSGALRVMPGWRWEFVHFYACVYSDPWTLGWTEVLCYCCKSIMCLFWGSLQLLLEVSYWMP